MKIRHSKVNFVLRPILVATLLMLVTALAAAQSLTYVTSWLGNSYSGTPNMTHVQLNIDGMFVTADGRILTTSSWDEGGRTNSIYQNGALLTPPDFSGDYNSDQVVTDGTYLYYAGWSGVHRYTMTGTPVDSFGSGIVNGLAIANGLVYVGVTSSSLVQVFDTSNAQLVQSFSVASPTRIAVDQNGGIWVAHLLYGSRATDTVDCYSAQGTHLRSITLPNHGDAAALAIDNKGRLLICDNGPDLNIKIYSNLGTSNPTLVGTHGVQGGALAGPVQGLDGPMRFLAMTGVGTDSKGSLFVSQNGKGPGYLPGGANGTGTLLDFYSSGPSFTWRLQGLEFVSLADVDPASENDVYDLGHRFTMNYAKTVPGSEATYRSCTYNQFKYPDDNRYCPFPNLSVVNSVSCKRIQGQLFLFMSSQAGSFYEIYRFDHATDGDIAIPCGGFSYGGSDGYLNVANAPASGEWIWYDSRGTGTPESNEYSQPANAAHIDGQWWFTDTNGDVWQARGEGPAIGHYTFQGLDSRGIPKYDWKHFAAIQAPSGFTSIDQIIYIPSSDTMVLMGNSLTEVAAYPKWSAGNRVASWMVSIPASASNAQAAGMAVAGDYVFINYYVPHQVLVYNVSNGTLAGAMVPGPEVGGPSAVGNVDMPMCINAYQRSNGEYLIFGEEDFQAKVLMYRWNPDAPVLQALPGNSHISLTWSTAPGALSYNLYRGTTPGGEAATPLATGIKVLKYSDTTVSNGQIYYYRVSAVTSQGVRAPSIEVSATPTAQGTPILQINCGGPSIENTSWIADTGSGGWTSPTGQTATTTGLVNPAPQAVYQTVRGGNSTYSISGLMPGTKYTVRLHFTEYFWSQPNQREFNVTISGQQVLKNFDIFADAGGQNIADIKQFAVQPTTSSMTISFKSTVDNAIVCGIEVLKP